MPVYEPGPIVIAMQSKLLISKSLLEIISLTLPGSSDEFFFKKHESMHKPLLYRATLGLFVADSIDKKFKM